MEKMFHLGNLTFLFRAQQTGQEFIDIESAAEVVEDNRIETSFPVASDRFFSGCIGLSMGTTIN
jgi:hypothetical protein